MVLRLGRAAGAPPVLTLPPSVPVSRAKAFALDQEGWLRSRLAAAPARIPVRAGVSLPFRGAALTVVPADGGRTRVGARHARGGGARGVARRARRRIPARGGPTALSRRG